MYAQGGNMDNNFLWGPVTELLTATASVSVAAFLYCLNKRSAEEKRLADKARIDSAFMRLSLELDYLESFLRDRQGRKNPVDEVAGKMKYVPLISRAIWKDDLALVLPQLVYHRAQYLAMIYKDLLFLDGLRFQWAKGKENHVGCPLYRQFIRRLEGYMEDREKRERLLLDLRIRAFGRKWANVHMFQPEEG